MRKHCVHQKRVEMKIERKRRQSYYNREFLSPISNIDFQIWTIWAAQGTEGSKGKVF